MTSSELQDSVAFFKDLKKSIQHAKNRIWIQVMIFEMVPEMEAYVNLLIAASHRGVEVKLVFDWISERYYGENLDVYPIFTPTKIKKRKLVHQFAVKMYKKLRDNGVSVTITNTPSPLGKLFLLGNRNHNKLFIIDTVCWTGGINMITNPNTYIDSMVKMYNPALLASIEKYFLRKQKYNGIDVSTDTYTFLIDGGQKGASLIYDTSIKLIKNAKRDILFVSQMLPDSGFLAELLKKAEQGTTIQLVISNAKHNIFTKFPFRYHYSRFESRVAKNPNIAMLHSLHRIHAKLLITDDTAIFGSHNFAKWNELIGIEETGFLTTDKQLVAQYRKFVESIKE